MAFDSIPFEEIRKNPNKYAETFAEGSPALGGRCKKLWSLGVKIKADFDINI